MNADQLAGRYFWLSTFFLCQHITFPYLYDSLFAAYKEQIVEELGISHTQFGLLFSIWPHPAFRFSGVSRHISPRVCWIAHKVAPEGDC